MKGKLLAVSITILLLISLLTFFPSVSAVENTPPRFETEWSEVAGKLGDESKIYSLVVYNDSLFGGTFNGGKLYKWNDVDSWIEVADSYGGESMIYSLIVYDNSLYGSGVYTGSLYKWNDVDSWIQVAGQLGLEQTIMPLAVYDGGLYGGTGSFGRLYKWNDVDSWIEVAGYIGEDSIYSLAVYNGNLYGGTGSNGKLYKWNDIDSWIEVAGYFSDETYIYSLAVYNNNLYGGTGGNGKLYKWDDVDMWIEVAGQLGGEQKIQSLTIYNNNLYGSTGYSETGGGKLFKWNDVDSWIQVAGQFGSESEIRSLTVYNNNLFGGTAYHGSLFKLSQAPVPSHNSINILIDTILAVHVSDDNDDNMSVSFYWSNDTFIKTITDIISDTYAVTSSLSLDYNTTYSWYAIANDSYSETTSDIFTFKTMPEPNFSPDKPTCVSPTDNEENVSITTTLKIHATDRNNDAMNVSFYFIEGEPIYAFYDSNDMQTWLTFPSAIRLSPTELNEHDGEYLTGVMIHDANYSSDSGGVIEIYADGNETHPRVLTTSQNTPCQDGSGWNEIILDNPVLINNTHHIWVVVIGANVGLDNTTTESGKSDLINMTGEWQSLYEDFAYDYDNMIRVRIGGLYSHISTISDVTSDTDVETSSLSLGYNTGYNWCAIADDSVYESTSDTFTFTTESEPSENTTPVFEHVVPRVESDGYLYMIYRNDNINVSNLNLLMGSYSPFTVCKYNYTSLEWDCEVITINTNDYIRVKIDESDIPYNDTLIPINPQIRFKISDADVDDKLNIILTSNSSGVWSVITQWINVSEGWFSSDDSNMDEYNTTYYYKLDVMDSFGNILISDFSFTTTSTEPSIPPITPTTDIYIYTFMIILIGIGGSVYILSKKKKIKFK